MTDQKAPIVAQPCVGAPPRRPWMDPFLAVLRETGNAAEAARRADIGRSTAPSTRARYPWFKAEWEAALAATRPKGRAKRHGQLPPDSLNPNWRTHFLEALAETSNVTAAAAQAQVQTRRVYRLRREDPQFAARWRAALFEGYENLELELLGYLRERNPERKLDVAAALRLLAMHRDTVARERALRGDDDDEQAVFDSIDTFIEDMRRRRAANAAILIQAEPVDAAQ